MVVSFLLSSPSFFFLLFVFEFDDTSNDNFMLTFLHNNVLPSRYANGSSPVSNIDDLREIILLLSLFGDDADLPPVAPFSISSGGTSMLDGVVVVVTAVVVVASASAAADAAVVVVVVDFRFTLLLFRFVVSCFLEEDFLGLLVLFWSSLPLSLPLLSPPTPSPFSLCNNKSLLDFSFFFLLFAFKDFVDVPAEASPSPPPPPAVTESFLELLRFVTVFDDDLGLPMLGVSTPPSPPTSPSSTTPNSLVDANFFVLFLFLGVVGGDPPAAAPSPFPSPVVVFTLDFFFLIGGGGGGVGGCGGGLLLASVCTAASAVAACAVAAIAAASLSLLSSTTPPPTSSTTATSSSSSSLSSFPNSSSNAPTIIISSSSSEESHADRSFLSGMIVIIFFLSYD